MGEVEEISVICRKDSVGEYIGEGEKQTDWLSHDCTCLAGASWEGSKKQNNNYD